VARVTLPDPPDPPLPGAIRTEEALDDLLTRPRPALVEFIRSLRGPLLVLGAGGKMGPTLAVLARRAADAAGTRLRVIAASRFGDEKTVRWLDERGVETARADLLDRRDVEGLPEAAEVVYLVGFKFGTSRDPARAWATNAIAPALVAERFPRARIVALSTGNVYSLVPIESGGARETDTPAPAGEYAAAALARERIFEYFSARNGTPVAILRLNYALDLRYGVLADIARRVWSDEPLDLSMGHLNCIWQGDANELILRALPLAAAPAAVFNLTGADVLSVRELAGRFGRLLGKEPRFMGTEAPTALLSNSSRLHGLLGTPPTPLDAVLRWTAEWVKGGGRDLGKPTHYEVRNGKF